MILLVHCCYCQGPVTVGTLTYKGTPQYRLHCFIVCTHCHSAIDEGTVVDAVSMQDMTPLRAFGSVEPMGWFDEQGRYTYNPAYRKPTRNSDYIEPAKLPEPAQYEQALVEYDYEREQ